MDSGNPAGGRPAACGRRIIIFTAIILILGVFIYTGGEWYRSIDYRDRFNRMKGSVEVVETVPEERQGQNILYWVEIRSDRETEVWGYLKVPGDGAGPYPALVILGGLRTGPNTVHYLGKTTGIVILALDYPYRGKREDLGVGGFIRSIPRIRRAVVETVPAVMLGVDYLLSRDDVDENRITMVGGSLGAMFVPAVAASHSGVSAAAILFGAAGLERLISESLEVPSPLADITGWIGAVLVSPVEPLKYADKISPRPLFMLSGIDDERIPPECSRLLHRRADHPKTVRWIRAGHLHVKSEEFHRRVSRRLSEWMVSKGLMEPGSFGY